MAVVKTEGIILRTQEVRETSLLMILYTRDLGKVRGLAKGVRGARAACPWYLEPLTLQAVVLYERRRSPLMLVSSCDLLEAFDSIKEDLDRVAYASLCLDLVERMTEVGQVQPEIFHLLLGVLKAFGQEGQPRTLARYLEAHLLTVCGFLPSLEAIALSPGGKLSLQQILQAPVDRAARLRLTGQVEEELRKSLASFSQRVLEEELKSRTFLHAVGLEI